MIQVENFVEQLARLVVAKNTAVVRMAAIGKLRFALLKKLRRQNVVDEVFSAQT